MADAMTAAIRVNGQDEPLAAATIAALLETREISPQMRGIAVARNGSVVRRADWATTAVRPGDVIEIVLARQGG
ncbi:MAG TPA: sulfur carrier protein ThiS [Xanthobacteraceae bacterium]|nr:sulfur carrier protein ThiS [Xanthobacteraceae bacterium]